MWLWANDITTAWRGVPNGTLSMFTCCPNLMFPASLCDWRYIDFQTGYFADFEQFKVDIYFGNSGQVTIDPIVSFYWLWTGHSYFIGFG